MRYIYRERAEMLKTLTPEGLIDSLMRVEVKYEK